MRELHEVDPAPQTSEEVLRFGLSEIAALAPGGHGDPTNPCYGEKRDFKEYAQRILDAARLVDPGRGRAEPNGLEHPAEVASHLRAAIVELSAAHRHAGVSEGERVDLNGLVRDLIFGLNSAVEALNNMVEETDG